MVKKVNRGDNTIITKSFTLSDNGINVSNYNVEQISSNVNRKIIKRKELLPEIIKEFDKKMKKQILNSYIYKKIKNPKNNLSENKKDKENISSNHSNILPRINVRNKKRK